MKTILISISLLFCIQLCAQSNFAIKLVEDISYYPDSLQVDFYIKSQCRLDIYYPENAKDFATVIWFHGGWLREGSKQHFPQELLNYNLCVVSVGYRLSPKVEAPAYIQDAAAAVAWVFNNIENYGGDANKIFVAGHSAGGYLVSMVGLDTQYLNFHGIDANQIAGLFPLSGQTITHTTVRKEQGIADSKVIVDQYAPLNHARQDAPPMLLITGDRNLDIPGRYEENLYLKKLMEIAGHKETSLLEMQGYDHMMINPSLPIMVKEIEKICKKIHSID